MATRRWPGARRVFRCAYSLIGAREASLTLLGTPRISFNSIRWHTETCQPLGIRQPVIDQLAKSCGCSPHGEEQRQAKVCRQAAHVDRSLKRIVIAHGVEHQRFGQFTGVGGQEYRARTTGRS